jgi:phospholipid/cholesterol/gamma-HCH transport system substrate-binding protein
MSKTKLIETVVGVFVLLGVAALLALALRVSNLNLLAADESYIIKASFGNIGGLKVRAPVKMAGVLIGRVAAIGIDPKTYQAVAEMRIASQYRQIPSDSLAVIYTAGLLGEQYVSIDPGGDETFLKNGEEIKLTQSAVVLEKLIGQFLYNKASGDPESPKDKPPG